MNTTLYSTTCQGLGKKDTAKTFLTEVYGVLRNVFFSEDAESIVIRLPGKDVWQYWNAISVWQGLNLEKKTLTT